jgi:hypothetical protein
MESSYRSPDKPGDPKSSPPQKAGAASLRLPVTTFIGKSKDDNQSCPTGQKLDEAVKKQQDLLAEFEKITDELNRVLANLEGSTLLKRLKAAARLQYQAGGRIASQIGDTFGVGAQQVAGNAWKALGELSELENKASLDVSYIMDDMQSYFERRPFMRFKTVLEDMRKQDVIGSLRQLGEDLKKENGISIAQCDYWSDTLDRWAEDLVDPASGGT